MGQSMTLEVNMKNALLATATFIAAFTFGIMYAPEKVQARDWKPADNGSYIYASPLDSDYSEGLAILHAEDYTPVIRYIVVMDESVPADYVWRLETITINVDKGEVYTVNDIKFTKQQATIDTLIATNFTVPDDLIDEMKEGDIVRVKFTTYDNQKFIKAYGLSGFTKMHNKFLSGDFE
tara:strand:+ start:87 stop:623 length:537 start_codon:yes stop_codon:yes gene_type:complete